MAVSQRSLRVTSEKFKNNRQVKHKKEPLKDNPFFMPIYECLMSADLLDVGGGIVLVSRKNQHGDVAVAFYLIDSYCLGVKNCSMTILDIEDYQNRVNEMRENEAMVAVKSTYAGTLIYRVIQYAQSLGFDPPPAFEEMVGGMLHGISIDPWLQFIFGRAGRPCYVRGLSESVADVIAIVGVLLETVGEGNFDVLIGDEDEDICGEDVTYESV